MQRGKTVVMALNQLQLLPHFDNIICLDNSTVVYSGSYADLPPFDWLRGGGIDLNKGQETTEEQHDGDVGTSSGSSTTVAPASQGNTNADATAVIKAAEAAAAAADGIGTDGRDEAPVLIKEEAQKTGRVSVGDDSDLTL